MMKRLLVLILLISPVIAVSQENTNILFPYPPSPPWRYGSSGAVVVANHTGGGLSMMSSDHNSNIGFSVGYGVQKEVVKGFALQGLLKYQSRPITLIQHKPIAAILLPDAVQPITQEIATTTEISYQSINLSMEPVLVVVRLSKKIAITASAGIALDWVIDAERTQYSDMLYFPDDTAFTNISPYPLENEGKRMILKREEDVQGLNPFQFGLTGSLGVEYKWDRYYFTPTISYDHSLTNVTSRPEEDGWKVHSLAFRLDIRKEL